MAKKTKKMTQKQKLFVKEYLVDLNGTQAAIRAGYSSKTADAIACNLMSKSLVSQAVSAEMDKRAAKLDITAERVLKEVARLAFADLRKAFKDDGGMKDIGDLDDDTAAALSSIESDDLYDGIGEDRAKVGVTRKIKLNDKNAALTNCMRHLGMFEKDNAQKSVGAVVIADIKDLPADEKMKILQKMM